MSENYITQIKIRSGDVVDNITYTTSDNKKTEAGDSAGGGVFEIDLTNGVVVDEISVVKFDWWGFDCIAQLTFRTSDGKTHGPYGGDGKDKGKMHTFMRRSDKGGLTTLNLGSGKYVSDIKPEWGCAQDVVTVKVVDSVLQAVHLPPALPDQHHHHQEQHQYQHLQQQYVAPPHHQGEYGNGILKVLLIEGQNLEAHDIGGTSDPYVVATVGKQKQRSQTIKKTISPVWNQTLCFSGINELSESERVLQLDLFDEDRMTKDDKMGSATVPLATLFRSVPAEMVLPLHDARRGHIKVQLTAEGFGH